MGLVHPGVEHRDGLPVTCVIRRPHVRRLNEGSAFVQGWRLGEIFLYRGYVRGALKGFERLGGDLQGDVRDRLVLANRPVIGLLKLRP
jgi:hypothetical protein